MPFTPEQKRAQRAQKAASNWRQRAGGVGQVGMIVLRKIQAGDNSPMAIAKALKGHCTGPTFDQLMGRLQREGYICRNRGGWWFMTAKAWALLPVATAAFTSIYKPPVTPWRRPGSDHSHIPSIAAGRSMEYRHPV